MGWGSFFKKLVVVGFKVANVAIKNPEKKNILITIEDIVDPLLKEDGESKITKSD